MSLDSYIKNGRLCWTMTSNGYKYLTWNFVLHWRKASKHPMLVICADRTSYNFLQRESIPCVLAAELLPDYGTSVVPFGSRNFSTLNRMKLYYLAEFARRPEIRECCYLDGDVIVYADFLDGVFGGMADQLLALQCDEQKATCGGKDNEKCPNGCTGVVLFKHGIDPAVFTIHDEAEWQLQPEDQVWVNKQLVRLGIHWIVLSREGFPNGARAAMTKRMPELGAMAYLLHYNYRVGDVKKIDMKRYGDWLLPY
jgi:hypothetical protein